MVAGSVPWHLFRLPRGGTIGFTIGIIASLPANIVLGGLPTGSSENNLLVEQMKTTAMRALSAKEKMCMEKTKSSTYKNIMKGGALVLCVLFFTLPLVQCTQDRSLTASGWEIATGTGDLYSAGDSGDLIVFLLLIVPGTLLILAFMGKPFNVLRNVSIAGVVAKIAFMIVAHARISSDGILELTGFNWLVLILYIGLCVLAHYGISTEYRGAFSAMSNRKCRQCEKIYSGASLCPNCGSALFEETSQNVSGGEVRIQSPLASNTGDTWYCKKCSTVNALTATACKDCGAYK